MWQALTNFEIFLLHFLALHPQVLLAFWMVIYVWSWSYSHQMGWALHALRSLDWVVINEKLIDWWLLCAFEAIVIRFHAKYILKQQSNCNKVTNSLQNTRTMKRTMHIFFFIPYLRCFLLSHFFSSNLVFNVFYFRRKVVVFKLLVHFFRFLLPTIFLSLWICDSNQLIMQS